MALGVPFGDRDPNNEADKPQCELNVPFDGRGRTRIANWTCRTLVAEESKAILAKGRIPFQAECPALCS